MSELKQTPLVDSFLGVAWPLIEQLKRLHRHYPDGPDCIGPINQTLRAIEQLVNTTLSSSLRNIHSIKAQRAQKSKLRNSLVLLFAGVALALIAMSIKLSPAQEITMVFASLSCLIWGSFGAFESNEKIRRLKSRSPEPPSLINLGAEIEDMRTLLSATSQKALHNPMPSTSRIDRSVFDDLNQRISERLGDKAISRPIRDKIAFVRRSNWVNALYLLDRFAEDFNEPDRALIHAQFLSVLAESTDQIVIQLPAETRSNMSANEEPRV